MTVTLTGPLLLPGNDEPMTDADVRIRFVAGSPRDVGFTYDNGSAAAARLGSWAATSDDEGDFTVTVPTIGASTTYPATGWYECTIGGGRWPKFVLKVQPISDGTWNIADPDIRGEDLLPPDFVQVDPTSQNIAEEVAEYFDENPIDVTDEVAAALTATPPLFVANNLSELTATQNTARLNIGAASDSEMDTLIAALSDRIATLEAFINTGGAFLRAPGFNSVTFSAPSGVPTFETDP